MTRPVSLSAIKAGMTRLREKGGASPESLYLLLNGYVTASRTCKMRPGSDIDTDGLAGTLGLVLFRGKFVVFASEFVDLDDPDYELEILKHPVSGSAATLVDIRFAAPFLGYLYVVALWSDGLIVHYWLQAAEAWQANHVYIEGQVVLPSTPTGYAYKATRISAREQLWAPNVARAVGDRVEPTVSNSFLYQVVDTLGDNPRSGATEPDWIAADGALVYEDASGPGGGTGSGSGGGTPTSQLPPEVEDRYKPSCVVASMWIDAERRAGDTWEGDEFDAHHPKRGFHRAVCIAAGEIVLQPCVRLVCENGCAVQVSRSTPINFADAPFDMAPGYWAMAPDVLDQVLLTDLGPSKVALVMDIGEQPVAPRDLDGNSFAAGEVPTLRIYTHNMAKNIE